MTNSAVKEASSHYQLSTVKSQFANVVGQVPVGYKQTEVGVIPEDWEVCELGEAITFQRGFDLPHRLRVNGDVPIISSSGESGRHNKAMVKAPGIVTGRYGTIGQIFYIENDYWPLNTTLYAREFKKLSPEYALHLLQTVGFESHSGKSGVPGVNRNDIHKEKVAVPPVAEQTAIANALSDVDALIQELEKLIAKKQAIKTATMQQLLTGRTRLPPFALREDGTKKGTKQSELGEIPEDWVVFPLLDIATLIHGKAHERYVVDAGKYVVVNSKFVSTEGKVRKYCSQNDCAAKKGDVLMVLSDLPNGKALAKCFYADKNDVYAVNQRVCIFRSNVFDSKYLQLILNRHKYFLALDDGVTQTHILNGDIANCQLYAPENREEQTAIATIFSDMDEELQALEQHLSKTRQIKQGMMQELLTGKTRLMNAKETAHDQQAS